MVPKTKQTGGPDKEPVVGFVQQRCNQHLKNVVLQAVEKVRRFGPEDLRRAEQSRLKGRPLAQRLKGMRWQLLRRGSRVRGQARSRLKALLASKLATARAWSLKECFDSIWHYRSPVWVAAFLHFWCAQAMRSRLEPMKKVARMLRAHEPLMLNWFKANGELSSAAVEGLNNKVC